MMWRIIVATTIMMLASPIIILTLLITAFFQGWAKGFDKMEKLLLYIVDKVAPK